MELAQIDNLIKYLAQRGDSESLATLQEALIQRSNQIESELWKLYHSKVA